MSCNSGNSLLDCQKTMQELQIYFDKLTSLKSSDISSRVNILKDIEIFFSTSNVHITCNNDVNELLSSVAKYIVTKLNDESEKCREISAKILVILFDSAAIVSLCLPYILTILVNQLGKSDSRESSEEVRLLEINMLYKIIKNFNGDLLKYLTDISNTLCACITDEYPEIKRKSCECTSLLAENQSSSFHMISSQLLKPLLCTISHQHFKTRAVCVKTIGDVICHGIAQDFEEAFSHVAQRLFDHSPIVRVSVTEVIGLWLLTLKERYSFFNKLIPLMLASLHDIVPDVKMIAENLWYKCGEQYLKENENDYKDLMDFPQPDPDNYPTKEKRPFIGCRILVQRNIFNMLQPLINDLSDWAPATRIKAAQVFYSLILHAENKATMQLTTIITGIVSAAKDEEKEVVNLAISTAELLGFFLDSNLLCDCVLTLIHKSPSSVHLSIFAAVLRGNKKGLSSNCFEAACKLLSEPSICRLRQAVEQANLLLCVDGLLSSYGNVDHNSGYQLFTILSTVSGLTTNGAVSNKAMCLMNVLAEKQSNNLELLFKSYAAPLIKTLIANNELWTFQSPELPIFYFLVKSEYTDEEVLKLALPIMTNNLNVERDAKLRSKILMLLVSVFKKVSVTQSNKISEEMLSLIRLGVFPNLTWTAGKAANSLRTVAVACLFEIVNKNCIDQSMLKAISDDLLRILSTLSDDDAAANRLLACKILEILLPKLYGNVDDCKIHSTCHNFLQCMDDGVDEIRIITTKLLASYVKAFPQDYDWNSYRSHIKEMYHTAVIHMDDKNENIRESVFCLLKDVAFAAPKLLLDEIEEKRYLMTSDQYCENLIEYIKDIKI